MKFIFTVFACVLLTFCKPQPMNNDSKAETEIRSVRAESNRAIANHDTAAIARTWTIDYHIVSSRNNETSGRKANADRFDNEFTSKPDVIYIRTTGAVDVFDQWSMASETGTWIGRWTEEGETAELSGTYFAKWHKVEGQWLIRAEIFVPLKCRGKFCAKSPI
jgi:ketosteroid isomerase-like protein